MDKNLLENIGEKSLFQSLCSIIKKDNSPYAALGSRLSSYYLLWIDNILFKHK